jgi:hypothetical protein
VIVYVLVKCPFRKADMSQEPNDEYLDVLELLAEIMFRKDGDAERFRKAMSEIEALRNTKRGAYSIITIGSHTRSNQKEPGYTSSKKTPREIVMHEAILQLESKAVISIFVRSRTADNSDEHRTLQSAINARIVFMLATIAMKDEGYRTHALTLQNTCLDRLIFMGCRREFVRSVFDFVGRSVIAEFAQLYRSAQLQE